MKTSEKIKTIKQKMQAEKISPEKAIELAEKIIEKEFEKKCMNEFLVVQGLLLSILGMIEPEILGLTGAIVIGILLVLWGMEIEFFKYLIKRGK